MGRFPGEGNGNPLQDSCLENPMEGRAWWATVHGVSKNQTWLKWLGAHTHIYIHYIYYNENFPGGSDGKASVYNAGDLGSIPGSGRSLEKEMATHSSILAWRIPWKEEPGGLPSTRLQRVGHDWATSLSLLVRKSSRNNKIENSNGRKEDNLKRRETEDQSMRIKLIHNLSNWKRKQKMGCDQVNITRTESKRKEHNVRLSH